MRADLKEIINLNKTYVGTSSLVNKTFREISNNLYSIFFGSGIDYKICIKDNNFDYESNIHILFNDNYKSNSYSIDLNMFLLIIDKIGECDADISNFNILNVFLDINILESDRDKFRFVEDGNSNLKLYINDSKYEEINYFIYNVNKLYNIVNKNKKKLSYSDIINFIK